MRIKLFAFSLVVFALAAAIHFGKLSSKACGACPLAPFSTESAQGPLACCAPLWSCSILGECSAEDGCYCQFPDKQFATIAAVETFNRSQGQTCETYSFGNCVFVRIKNASGTVIDSDMDCCPQGGCGPSGN